MRVVVLYNAPTEDAPVCEADVLTQRDQVAQALEWLGHQSICLGCTLDLAVLREQLIQLQPDIVFNLVESLGNTDRLMVMSTILLDALKIPYTGAATDAILDTSNKVKAKERMFQAGLPTPEWFCRNPSNAITRSPAAWAEQCAVLGHSRFRNADQRNGSQTRSDHNINGIELSTGCATAAVISNGNGNGWTNRRWILKPVWEHASLGMDDSAVITVNDTAALSPLCEARQLRMGRPHFAERFIEGREFNLSILAGEVLPLAEIDFSSFPVGRPRILGYRAKWEPSTVEYQQTPRRFDFPSNDWPLLDQLANYARSCWNLFGLTGYARVDFRVDRDGQPWVLEVNTNPCLSPEAGFAAALTRANIAYHDAIRRIVADAVS